MGTDIFTNGGGDVYPQLSTYNNLQEVILMHWIWNGTIFMRLLIFAIQEFQVLQK
jgi:hypothetical protein